MKTVVFILWIFFSNHTDEMYIFKNCLLFNEKNYLNSDIFLGYGGSCASLYNILGEGSIGLVILLRIFVSEG